MKKKILAAIVCAAVMLTTACSNNNEKTSDPTSGSSKESSSSVVSDSKPEESSDNESSAPESQTPSEPESSTPEADGKFVHGKFDGNVYTSKFLGFKAEIADGWTIATDEELANQNGVADMSDENLNQGLDVNGMAYEMMALSSEESSVSIAVQNLDVTSGGVILSVEDYIDLSVSAIVEQYKAFGIEDAEAEKITENFLGKETVCLSTKVKTEEKEAVQKVFLTIKGKYMATVTFTAADDAEMTALLATFKAL